MSEASGARRARILAFVASSGRGSYGTKRLCEACAEVTATSGAGLMLMSGDTPHGALCTTNAMSDLVEQLQYTLGEGPCVDAYRQGWPVLEPDLVRPDLVRWPAFAPPAIEAGVRAVFGFPLLIGTVGLGALNLCRDSSGPLSDDQHADALVLADIAARAVLVLQAGAQPDQLASELADGADFHYAVHQASGMVAAQLDVSVGQALVRLRAYAFGNDRPLAEVAQAVVARQLHFGAASGEEGSIT